ncbi:MAG: IS110 family transposase [Erysipelotrichaceae bacterium]
MFYIGIDVAKFDHCACVVDSDGEVFVEPFYFTNNHEGFSILLKNIKPYLNKRHIAGLESTAHYADNLIAFLLDNNIDTGFINPISTDSERKKHIRKTKNDKKDTYLICRVLQSRTYTHLTKVKWATRQAKQLTRYHATLSCAIKQHKTQLQRCIDLVFPEFNSLFKTKYSRAYMAVLEEYGSAVHIANANLTHLKNILSPKGRGKPCSIDANKLRSLAQKSVGEDNDIILLELNQHLQMLELLESQQNVVDEKIEELASQTNSPIFTIPGIGTITGMSILSEIGDFGNFSSAAKIIALAGIDPAVYQSGNYNAERTSISKRGSPLLRLVLYQAALTVCNCNLTFKTYYNQKIAQGKSHRCAQGHICRKLIRVVYKLITDNIAFDANALK